MKPRTIEEAIAFVDGPDCPDAYVIDFSDFPDSFWIMDEEGWAFGIVSQRGGEWLVQAGETDGRSGGPVGLEGRGPDLRKLIGWLYSQWQQRGIKDEVELTAQWS